MESVRPRKDHRYPAYRAEVVDSKMGPALRSASLFVIGLNTAFVALDIWTQSDRLGVFLGIRLTWNALMIGVYWLANRIDTVTATTLGCLVTGFALIGLSYAAGGVSSVYWPALMVLLLGMPVLLPLSPLHASGIVGVLLAAFASLPLLMGEASTFSDHIVPVFFVMAAGVECIASCAVLDGMRFADFTRRLEVEQARDELKELDREKSRFTANVHHELRTPLTLMLAPLDAMLAGDFGRVNDSQRSYLKTMHSNAQRLLKLINNLLDLAKIEGQRLAVRRRPLQVAEVIEEIVRSARPLAERKGVELSTRGLDELPVVNADPDSLEKVIVNLVGNALKFTPEGGRIEVCGSAPPDGGVEFVVVDSGEGIPADQLDAIFDRFAQGDSSNTRRHEGTGIGLALVKELVDLHSGRIWAESAGWNTGSEFHVVLPEGEADPVEEEELIDTSPGRRIPNALAALEGELDLEAEEDEEGDASHDEADLRLAEMQRSVERAKFASEAPEVVESGEDVDENAPEVLIVEDNGDMRKLLAFFVSQEYRVRVARNGREGLDKIREAKPDLVLTDVMMPEMSGTELCHHVKADPATWSIPVVLVTSKAEREMKIRGLERGADDYVTKPFHPRELMARIRSLIRVRVLQDELAVRNALLESTNEELKSTLQELKEAGAQLVQAERLAAVGELAAGVAHEVNNPVNFATNALKTLRTYVDDIQQVACRLDAIDWSDTANLDAQVAELAKLRDELEFHDIVDALAELVGIATDGLDRTHRLVGDLRDFAAPGAPERAEVDLVRGVQSTLQLVRHTAKGADVELLLDVPEMLPRVQGDARALNQVFLNLIKNGIEALGDGGGVVTVRARAREDAVVVEVRDDGPGIEPALRERLFEPFFSTKEAGRGTGLGLSISRRIVLEHGGEISVDSTPGSGTCFTVTVPLGSQQHEA